MVKILFIDIETSPNIAYVWGAWKQNIGTNQWKQKSHIMSFAAKWHGDEDIMYFENRKANDKRIVTEIFKLLDSADIVVAHNGAKFDLPTIIGRGIIHGLKPPSPYHLVDTLRIARKEFRFVSNSLANLANELGLTKKSEHKKYPGFELWLACLRGEDEAWNEMRDYNISDVITLEELYTLILPYIKAHPNLSVYSDKEFVCTHCGGHHIQQRGFYHSKAGLTYKRFVCVDCGSWSKSKIAGKDKEVTGLRSGI